MTKLSDTGPGRRHRPVEAAARVLPASREAGHLGGTVLGVTEGEAVR